MGGSFVWSQIYWPHKLEQRSVDTLLRQVAASGADIGPIAFEVWNQNGKLHYCFGAKAKDVDYIAKLLKTHIGGALVTPLKRSVSLHMAVKLKPVTIPSGLRTDQPQHITEAILAAISEAGKNEEIVLHMLLGTRHEPQVIPDRLILYPVIQPLWQTLLQGDFGEIKGARRRAWKAKLSDYGFSCSIRIGVRAASGSRRRSLCNRLLGGLRIAQTPETTLRLTPDNPLAISEVLYPWRWPLRLNIRELCGLLGWPLGDKQYPGLDRSGSRLLQPSSRTITSERIVALSTAPATIDNAMSLPIDDALHHLHVMGPTGVGKSTLLLNLITQDIAAGRSVLVIDPKGDLNQEVMARIPKDRLADVVLLDPSRDNPVGFNPLLADTQSPELIADHLLAVFHGLYATSWGPRTQDILHACLLTLVANKNATLCDLPVLLTNVSARQKFLRPIHDPIALGPFWDWYDHLSHAERSQAVAPVMNKLRAFLLRPRMRAVLGQATPNFHTSQLLTDKKIVLVTLAKGTFGAEAAALLGSLVLASFWQAALGRTAIPAQARTPVAVYIDEFQDYLYLPTDLSDVLATSRSLGIAMTLAHQHMTQLPLNIRAAVLANARSRVTFQLAYDDAYRMAQTTELLTPKDFMNLQRYELYASLVVGGKVAHFSSGKSLPPPPCISDPDYVLDQSLRRYGQSVDNDTVRQSIAKPYPSLERVFKTHPGNENA